ncbi:outer membrane protein-like protein iml2 [Mollisia scopiformis]|uniref:Inclusion body clearance protein IML2 n=1 Tax=Mollisia scopiformis TaxID=149040 RepID=A0A194XJB0_MOLSC|nr:outer membrane protein-like protein iml2 [Mollisia scopiformis]KUJ20335.1 outer membrane protein-like protein iml2 [Mollisia scopiformis]
MSRWFRGVAKSNAPSMIAEEEDQHLHQVEEALLRLLNDDIAEADRILKQQDSSYHHLGRGISSFIASMLGVEKELLKDAAATLQVAETKTWEDMKKAQREPTAFQSHIYPPGTEYLLCFAISQLTSAICAVLSGSVTEAVKAFYKLRKSYLTLDGIMEIEANYLKQQAASPGLRTSGHLTNHLAVNTPPASSHGTSIGEKPELGAGDEKASLRAPSMHSNATEPDLHVLPDPSSSIPATRVESKLLDIDPASVGITNHTDIFIHSGTRLCYGILLVVFSMIENPLFSKILYIVGFKGDRERGTRYLWQAARFNNFNSAIAGITLLGYYNGLVGFCDILPTDAGAADDLSAYPRAKCNVLLADMRRRYPESKLWKMEEARMHAYNRNLEAAVKILAENSDSSMKQIATINMFEMSLSSMFLHEYELCAKSWIQCSELSAWSPTLYAYMTGGAYLELYRNLRLSDPKAAGVYKEKATEYFRKGPPMAGRQKVMSKQLPFDVYITRKVQKWEERAKAWEVDLADAIGVSPLAEMVYFWGGPKKQGTAQLQKSLDILQWERTSHPEKLQGDLDETAIQAVLRAASLKNMGKYDEAREVLKAEVLKHDRNEFKGHLKDDWTCPSAHYEMACLAWNEKDLEGADPKAKVVECEEWLEKTQKWEQYILDTRMSVKITTSLLTIKRHKRIMGM